MPLVLLNISGASFMTRPNFMEEPKGRARMRGVLLRSGKVRSFTALGETGQPVYRAALQLREPFDAKAPTSPNWLNTLPFRNRTSAAVPSTGTATAQAT